ncbi:MAG TPA: radical SAM protein [Desulfuromonadales bacterium]|nr:radical SAM protein [Desulfuromonadales bacterium]
MKIVIVENPRPLTIEHYNDVANAPLSASLNSGYALAIARQAGWDTAHLDFSTSGDIASASAARILAEDADIVLFHWVYAWGHEELLRTTITQLRNESRTRIGAFGLFPTLSCNRLLQYAPQLDFILAGEFEDSLNALLRHFEKEHAIAALPGVVIRGRAFVPRPLIEDLSTLPIPDDTGANCSYPSLNIAASRGCFGECSFCFIHRYYGCSRRRTRDLPSLERELEVRLARRDIQSLYFIDPTFIGRGESERNRALQIGQMAQRLALPFGFEARVDCIDEQLMTALTLHGATSVFLGIESGCDSVLKRIDKRITTDQIRQAVRIITESGLHLNLGFIMFEPDSTLAELEANYRFLEELGVLSEQELTANLLYHNQIVLFGSSAWESFEKQGRLLLDERLPFEARCRFRDERVASVCEAMGRLTSVYFRAMDANRPAMPDSATRCTTVQQCLQPGMGSSINELIKNAFQDLCRAAHSGSPKRISQVEHEYAERLHNIPVM